MRSGAVVIGALIVALATSSAMATVRISSDPGGQIGRYLDSYAALRDAGERVVIDGPCLSACTLVLGVIPRDRICVTARARLGFHAAWRLDDNGRQIDSPAGTRFLISTYPEPVRAWIVKNGGLKSRTIYLTGNGLAAMDRQICMEPINRDVVATNYPQPRRSKYASVW